jgi:hypothetical protein
MGGGVGTVEVSTNGGFNWTVIPTSNANGFSCPSGATCNATVTGDYGGWSDPSNWQLRQLNLSNYVATGLIHLRFHLVTSNSVDDGWYVTDIAIGGTLAGP